MREADRPGSLTIEDIARLAGISAAATTSPAPGLLRALLQLL
jgi:hypothetical protein